MPRNRSRGTTVQANSSLCDPRIRGVGAYPRAFGVRRRYWMQNTSMATYTPRLASPVIRVMNQIRLSTCQAISLACGGMIDVCRIMVQPVSFSPLPASGRGPGERSGLGPAGTSPR